MENTQARYVAIDEEGYPLLGELRVADREIGLEILQNLKRNDNGSFKTTLHGETYFVESFDDPLVAQTVEKKSGQWILQFPYGDLAKLDFSTLSLDEWDRFHGRTEQNIPFVFSRKAQALFFNAVDSFDDDSVTVDGKTFSLKPWLQTHEAVGNSKYWTTLYQNSQPPWELEQPAPALADMFPRMKWPKSRILILGAGSGNDAAFFAEHGHLVTAVDISEEAIQRGQKKYGHLGNIRWLQADAFKLPSEFDDRFDLVFEHTCYCAIDPSRRTELVKTWLRCLTHKGHLFGIFFVNDRQVGPPFGGSEWEVRERLRKHFDFRFWGRWHQSPPHRHGCELFVFAEKKN